jgi:hypothetical protein
MLTPNLANQSSEPFRINIALKAKFDTSDYDADLV